MISLRTAALALFGLSADSARWFSLVEEHRCRLHVCIPLIGVLIITLAAILPAHSQVIEDSYGLRPRSPLPR
jgi:hypothetical protein